MNSSTVSGSSEIQWCFSQVKGTLDDDVTEGKTPPIQFFSIWFNFLSKILFYVKRLFWLILLLIFWCFVSHFSGHHFLRWVQPRWRPSSDRWQRWTSGHFSERPCGKILAKAANSLAQFYYHFYRQKCPERKWREFPFEILNRSLCSA